MNSPVLPLLRWTDLMAYNYGKAGKAGGQVRFYLGKNRVDAEKRACAGFGDQG